MTQLKGRVKQKILLIKLSSLGDVIFNIPLANVLKSNNYEVHWLVSEKGLPVLENNDCVDKVILAPFEKWKKEKNIIKNIVEFFKIVKQIRNENYSIVLDTQMRLKSLFFTIFCNSKRRIISKDAKEFSFLGANEIIPSIKNNNKTHVVCGYLKYAAYLGLDVSDIKISLPTFSNEIKGKVEKLLGNIAPNKPIVIIAPTTTWTGKHWDKENWKKLVSMIKDDYNLIFTGTIKNTEYIEYIRNGCGINLAGKTNLIELIELLKKADLVVSLDSGTTHLAWAAQNPKIVSIYCCTPSELYAPIGDDKKYVALSSENCYPCHHKKCIIKNKYICTQSPPVELVQEKIKELLS